MQPDSPRCHGRTEQLSSVHRNYLCRDRYIEPEAPEESDGTPLFLQEAVVTYKVDSKGIFL